MLATRNARPPRTDFAGFTSKQGIAWNRYWRAYLLLREVMRYERLETHLGTWRLGCSVQVTQIRERGAVLRVRECKRFYGSGFRIVASSGFATRSIPTIALKAL
jgi:hypothetical protein